MDDRRFCFIILPPSTLRLGQSGDHRLRWNGAGGDSSEGSVAAGAITWSHDVCPRWSSFSSLYIFGPFRERGNTSAYGRGFFNPAVAVKLEIQTFPLSDRCPEGPCFFSCSIR